MSTRVLTAEEAAESGELKFRFAEEGFVADFDNIRTPGVVNFALVIEKDEATQTLKVVPLTRENVALLLNGTVPPATTIGKSDLLNVYATAVTETMCREREGFYAHCASCKQVVYKWRQMYKGPNDSQNYRIGLDGLCRHIDCSDPQKSESSP